MSKVAPLEFPKKGDARPPADATGRAPETVTVEVSRKAGRIDEVHPTGKAAAKGRAKAPAAAAGPSTPAAESAPAVPDLFADLEGRDDQVQINVTVPRWVRAQLKILTATGQAKTIKAITTEAIIRAMREIAEKGRAPQ